MQTSDLMGQAQEALKNAYAPYSKFQVGAAVQSVSGKIYTGCNVENIAYGSTICAERNAIFHAVAEEGPSFHMDAIALAANFQDAPAQCSPCGACRQVMAEFSATNTSVQYLWEGKIKTIPFTELLPDGFDF